MRIAVIVLSDRGAGLALHCLASLDSAADAGESAIVVHDDSSERAGDDASGSFAQLERTLLARNWNDWAKVIRAPAPRSSAAAHDLAIRSQGADAYLLLHSDTALRPDAIAQQRAALLSYPDIGIIGPCLLEGSTPLERGPDGALAPAAELSCFLGSGRVSRPSTRFDSILPAPHQAFEPEWPAFAPVLIRREVIEQVGPVERGYSMFFEDADYCRRTHQAGWRIVYWPHLDAARKPQHRLSGRDIVIQKKRAPRSALRNLGSWVSRRWSLRPGPNA
jgi:hypothetical protein